MESTFSFRIKKQILKLRNYFFGFLYSKISGGIFYGLYIKTRLFTGKLMGKRTGGSGKIPFMYQPLPWIGQKSLRREQSTLERWKAMEARLPEEPGFALDIGCNMGFFTFKLAEKGYFAWGIETAEFQDISNYVVKKTGLTNAVFSSAKLTPDNVGRLPPVDVVLFLGVWHHMAKVYDFETTKMILSTLYQKTNKVLFFETGSSVMKRYPFIKYSSVEGKSDTESWLIGLIGEACPGSRIENIGKFQERDAIGVMPKLGMRSIYAIYKNSPL